ncbi:MAG TPA: PRD domain-containing protein [Candidatus Eisenbacteria bacterium]|nr:PRD domain-containing protein [Candidatus Eisenbacteria bacterium]
MSALVPLDSRQARIARHLLQEMEPESAEEIATALRLTTRVVRYNLPLIETYLRSGGLQIVRRRGVGIWVQGDDEARAALRASLDGETGPQVLNVADRKLQALAMLLDRAPEPLHLADLEVELGASRPTVRRDVHAAEHWLEEHHLHLQYLPGVGLVVRGTEIDVRKGLLALVLEAVPPDVLLRQAGGDHTAWSDREDRSGGVARFTAGLDLATHRSILLDQLRELDDAEPMTIVATLYLAILARRVQAGRPAEFQSGQLRSLIDHPIADAAARIAAAMERRTGLVLGETDIAAITEFLLGFVEIGGQAAATDDADMEPVGRLVAAAAQRLHPSLADDDQLRRSLVEHLRRLRVRLRYGLPVSNPLEQEVRDRYPDVYEVATQIVAEVAPLGDAGVPSEEIGFLTMYLAGSLERNRLRPKIRVTVVCPAGMATAWILVSRLLAVFPQVEVTRVVSKTAFERGPDDRDTDVVVSTVPLGDDAEENSVVVSPLLRDRDIRRLSRLLGEPTH